MTKRQLTEEECMIAKKQLKRMQDSRDIMSRQLIDIEHDLRHTLPLNFELKKKELENTRKSYIEELSQVELNISQLAHQIEHGVDVIEKPEEKKKDGRRK